MAGIAVITVDGPLADLTLDISMDKIREVAKGLSHFTARQDEEIARYLLKFTVILARS